MTESLDISSDKIYPANLEMNDVELAFGEIFPAADRLYFGCEQPPTAPSELMQSHFTGIAICGERVVLTHNLSASAAAEALARPDNAYPSGKYLIASLKESGVSTYDLGLPSMTHPTGVQACGNFLVMGLQATPDARDSQIRIYDLRMPQGGQLLGSIERPEHGVDGVAMTKEAGAAGKYVIAAAYGSRLRVYRSEGDVLISPDGAGLPAFRELVLQNDQFSARRGTGLALVTQTDGSLYLFAMDAEQDGSHARVQLYKLDVLSDQAASCTRIAEQQLTIGKWDYHYIIEQITANIEYVRQLPGDGPALIALLEKYGRQTLDSSFRWGGGLAVTSPDSFNLFACDRNVLSVRRLRIGDAVGDFSVVVWKPDPWRKVPGAAHDIAVGSQGQVWVIGNESKGHDFAVYKWNGKMRHPAWDRSDGCAIRIAVDAEGLPWVVNSEGGIYRLLNGVWTKLPGRARDIGIGANGRVMVVGGQFGSTPAQVYAWDGRDWVTLGQQVWEPARIAVGPEGQAWVVSEDGKIYRQGAAGWDELPGGANDIGVGADGSAWIVGRQGAGGGYEIFRWEESRYWQLMPGGAVAVSVGPDGQPWIANNDCAIYRRRTLSLYPELRA